MRLELLCLSKRDESWIEDGVAEYAKRIKRYMSFETKLIRPPKQPRDASVSEFMKRECETLASAIEPRSHVVLLDKRGRALSSEDFAAFLKKLQLRSHRHVQFVIGGAYGFTADFMQTANDTISLSPMTFPHQLARLIFAEQLYRAFTILRGERYHHP